MQDKLPYNNPVKIRFDAQLIKKNLDFGIFLEM